MIILGYAGLVGQVGRDASETTTNLVGLRIVSLDENECKVDSQDRLSCHLEVRKCWALGSTQRERQKWRKSRVQEVAGISEHLRYLYRKCVLMIHENVVSISSTWLSRDVQIFGQTLSLMLL